MPIFRHKITGLTQDLPDHFRDYDFLECVETEDPCVSCKIDAPEPEPEIEEILTEPEIAEILTEPVERRMRPRKRS